MASDAAAEVAVFTHTNLGTHLAMPVFPHTTVADFQREVERTHPSCFPELGEIEVIALMVRRKSHFYHLPSSMPIEYAFLHQEGAWFLYVKARTLKVSDGPSLSNVAAINIGDHKCEDNHLTGSLVKSIGQDAVLSSGKKRTLKFSDGPSLSNVAAINIGDHNFEDNHLTISLVQNIGKDAVSSSDKLDEAKWNSSSMKKNPANISSKAVTVAGFNLLNCGGVSKHDSSHSTCGAFQGLPEEQLGTKAEICSSSLQIGASPPFLVRTPQKQSLLLSQANRAIRDKFVCSEVGKRIIVASNNIRTSDKQRHLTPLSKFRDGKLLCYKNLSRDRYLVFEISDSDD